MCDIPRLMKLVRQARGWTQADLAAVAGYSQSWVSKVMRGKQPLTLDQARDVSLRLGIPVHLLRFGRPGEDPARRREFGQAAGLMSVAMTGRMPAGEDTAAALAPMTRAPRPLDATMRCREPAGWRGSPPPVSFPSGADGKDTDPVNRREFGITALGAVAAAVAPQHQVPVSVSGDHLRALQRAAAELWARDREVGGSALSREATGHYATARAMLDTSSYATVVGAALQSVTAELAVCAGFAAHDAADQASARHLLTEAVLLAADDPLLAARAYSLLALQSSALAAGDGGVGRAREALRFLDLAEGTARHEPSPRLHAAIWMRRATASAPLGDDTMIRTSIAKARRELDRGDHPADPPWTAYVIPAEVTAHDALAMLRSGNPARAARLFREVLADPQVPPRNRALYQAYLAASLAIQGDRAQAVAEGLRLLPVLEGPVRSARTVNQLLPVREKVPHDCEFAVRFDAVSAAS
jgi:transcriptional regulator with XRE-family HTH domain